MFTIAADTTVFNRHIKDFQKKSNLSVGVVIRKFAFDLLGRIIRKNPTDTGRSRGAWFPAIEALGAASGKATNISISGKSKNFSQAEFDKGKSEGKFIDNTKAYGPEKYVEIVNGVDYILFLEYGYSKAAPWGMVRLSMREMTKGRLPKDMSLSFQKEWNNFYA